MYLYFNQLEGSIPPELGTLNTLEHLYVHANQLDGDIPTWLMDLSSLEYFSVADNRLNIHINDTELIAFLDENDPNWFITQTVPPVGVRGRATAATNTIYAYWDWTETALDGFFELGYRTIPGGEFIALDRTDRKTVTNMVVAVPDVKKTYSFAVRVITPSHEYNENTLISAWSEEVVLSTYDGPLNPPALVQTVSIDLRQGRPLITWAESAEAEYYHIYIGSSDYTEHLLDAWIEGVDYCSEGICIFIPQIDPVAGSYHVWMQSWGHDEYSVGGDSGYDGWTHTTFELPNTAPNALTGTTVTIANGQITLSWHAPAGATWYNIWLGTGSPGWTPVVFTWLDADTLGCGDGGTCTIPAFTLPAWEYVWYVKAWGPGGFNIGGMVDAPGWVQGDEISIP